MEAVRTGKEAEEFLTRFKDSYFPIKTMEGAANSLKAAIELTEEYKKEIIMLKALVSVLEQENANQAEEIERLKRERLGDYEQG